MAQQLPKKSGNVACHVVQSLFLDRLCSLMNPIEIALLLKEKALISDSTLELVMLKEDEQQSRKNYRILHDVLPCLSNEDKLSEFCEVLKTFERLKEIGQEIWSKFRSSSFRHTRSNRRVYNNSCCRVYSLTIVSTNKGFVLSVSVLDMFVQCHVLCPLFDYLCKLFLC